METTQTKDAPKNSYWDAWRKKCEARLKAKGKLARALVLARPDDDEDYLHSSECYLMACAVRYRMVQKHGSLTAKITDAELLKVAREADRMLLQISVAVQNAQQNLVVMSAGIGDGTLDRLRGMLKGRR